jgi:hypothetical protein
MSSRGSASPASRATPVLAALLTIVMAACSAATTSDQPVGSGGPGAPPSGRVSPPSSGGALPGAIPDAVLASVMDVAATEAGVAPADVTVVSAEPVTWGDGSLGCPQPGVMYTQALVDGYRVVVEAGGEQLDYRVGNGQVRLCEGFEPGGSGG